MSSELDAAVGTGCCPAQIHLERILWQGSKWMTSSFDQLPLDRVLDNLFTRDEPSARVMAP